MSAEGQKAWVAVLVAVIGCLGLLGAALIGTFDGAGSSLERETSEQPFDSADTDTSRVEQDDTSKAAEPSDSTEQKAESDDSRPDMDNAPSGISIQSEPQVWEVRFLADSPYSQYDSESRPSSFTNNLSLSPGKGSLAITGERPGGSLFSSRQQVSACKVSGGYLLNGSSRKESEEEDELLYSYHFYIREEQNNLEKQDDSAIIYAWRNDYLKWITASVNRFEASDSLATYLSKSNSLSSMPLDELEENDLQGSWKVNFTTEAGDYNGRLTLSEDSKRLTLSVPNSSKPQERIVRQSIVGACEGVNGIVLVADNPVNPDADNQDADYAANNLIFIGEGSNRKAYIWDKNSQNWSKVTLFEDDMSE